MKQLQTTLRQPCLMRGAGKKKKKKRKKKKKKEKLMFNLQKQRPD